MQCALIGVRCAVCVCWRGLHTCGGGGWLQGELWAPVVKPRRLVPFGGCSPQPPPARVYLSRPCRFHKKPLCPALACQPLASLTRVLVCGHLWMRTQASEKRAETFRALQHALDELCKRMTECEERNTSIVSRLSELDGLLSEEKSKWKA